MGKISPAEVLRLRAPSALSRYKSVRRSAQDDGFVGVLEKTNKLAPMEMKSSVIAMKSKQSRSVCRVPKDFRNDDRCGDTRLAGRWCWCRIAAQICREESASVRIAGWPLTRRRESDALPRQS